MAGRISYLGGIVKDGLVLHLDAGKLESYNRIGTTWTDLTSNRNNATLINGPLYNSNNGGSIVFDGSDDYSSINNSNSLNFGTGDFTVLIWVEGITSYPGAGKTILWKGSRFDQNIAGWSIAWAGGPPELYLIVGSDVARNEYLISGFNQGWNGYKMIGFKREKNGDTYFINNTTFSFLGNNTHNVNNAYNLLITKSGFYNLGLISCKIPKLMIYNKGLSNNEITQNYNALKGRFNL